MMGRKKTMGEVFTIHAEAMDIIRIVTKKVVFSVEIDKYEFPIYTTIIRDPQSKEAMK